MRKSFHNESISYLRKTNNEYVEVLESQLSALLSGTPGQVRKLIPDPENGLFSRFMYYHLPMKPDWNDVFADSSDVSLDDTYAALGRDWNEVYQKISKFEHILFSFTPHQQEQLMNILLRFTRSTFIAMGKDSFHQFAGWAWLYSRSQWCCHLWDVWSSQTKVRSLYARMPISV